MTTSDSGSDPYAVSHLLDGADSAPVSVAQANEKLDQLSGENKSLDDIVLMAMGDSKEKESSEQEETQTEDRLNDDEENHATEEPDISHETADEESSVQYEDDQNTDEHSSDDDTELSEEERKSVLNSKVGKENAKLRKKLRETRNALDENTDAVEVGKSILAYESENGVDRDTINGFLDILRSVRTDPQQAVRNLQFFTQVIANESGIEIPQENTSKGDRFITDIIDRYYIDGEDKEKLIQRLSQPRIQEQAKKPSTARILPGKDTGNTEHINATRRFRNALIDEVGESAAQDLEPKIAKEAKKVIAESNAKGIYYKNVIPVFEEAKKRVLGSRKNNKTARPPQKPIRAQHRSDSVISKATPKTQDDALASIAQRIAAGDIK